jgi:DNA-directed RNA polymerase subunit omega
LDFFMARVTVEDCVVKIPNRFKLILMAAYRAKIIEKGGSPLVSKDNDKPAILALREIAVDAMDLSKLESEAISWVVGRERGGGAGSSERVFQKTPPVADADADGIDWNGSDDEEEEDDIDVEEDEDDDSSTDDDAEDESSSDFCSAGARSCVP